MINELCTKSGRLLQRVDDELFSRSGRYLGRFRGNKVYDPDGRYCGTLVGDRVVYRTIDSAAAGAASTAAALPASTKPNHKGSPLWGVEPAFAD